MFLLGQSFPQFSLISSHSETCNWIRRFGPDTRTFFICWILVSHLFTLLLTKSKIYDKFRKHSVEQTWGRLRQGCQFFCEKSFYVLLLMVKLHFKIIISNLVDFYRDQILKRNLVKLTSTAENGQKIVVDEDAASIRSLVWGAKNVRLRNDLESDWAYQVYNGRWCTKWFWLIKMNNSNSSRDLAQKRGGTIDVTNAGMCHSFRSLLDRLSIQISTSDLHHQVLQKNLSNQSLSFWSAVFLGKLLITSTGITQLTDLQCFVSWTDHWMKEKPNCSPESLCKRIDVMGIQLESGAREETGRFRDVKRCVATEDRTWVSGISLLRHNR